MFLKKHCHPIGISGSLKVKMLHSKLGERLSPSTLIWRLTLLDLINVAGPILPALLTVFWLYHVWVTLSHPHGLWMSHDGRKEAEEELKGQPTRQELTFPDLFHTVFAHYIKEISFYPISPASLPQCFFPEPRASLRIGVNSFPRKLIIQPAPSHLQFPLFFFLWGSGSCRTDTVKPACLR